jgi:hypothetical protein
MARACADAQAVTCSAVRTATPVERAASICSTSTNPKGREEADPEAAGGLEPRGLQPGMDRRELGRGPERAAEVDQSAGERALVHTDPVIADGDHGEILAHRDHHTAAVIALERPASEDRVGGVLDELP